MRGRGLRHRRRGAVDGRAADQVDEADRTDHADSTEAAELMATAASVYRTVDLHLRRHWPGHRIEYYQWANSRLSDALPEFRVAEIAPRSGSEPWVYATVGTWQSPHRPGKGEEFFLLAPTSYPGHVRILDLVATYHFESVYPLAPGATLNLGRPWAPGALADHVYVAPAYPFGPSFETCEVPGGEIRFLWLVPVTEQEVDHRYRTSATEFEALLESANVDVIDPARTGLL